MIIIQIFKIPKKENPVSSAQIPNMPPTIANCSVNDLGGVSKIDNFRIMKNFGGLLDWDFNQYLQEMLIVLPELSFLLLMIEIVNVQ